MKYSPRYVCQSFNGYHTIVRTYRPSVGTHHSISFQSSLVCTYLWNCFTWISSYSSEWIIVIHYKTASNVNVNVYVYSLISPWVQRLDNLHPWYWNSLSYSLISSGENSAFVYFAAAIANHYNSAFSFHWVAITAGWTEVAWYERLTQHLYTWPSAWLKHRSPIQVLTGLDIA